MFIEKAKTCIKNIYVKSLANAVLHVWVDGGSSNQIGSFLAIFFKLALNDTFTDISQSFEWEQQVFVLVDLSLPSVDGYAESLWDRTLDGHIIVAS